MFVLKTQLRTLHMSGTSEHAYYVKKTACTMGVVCVLVYQTMIIGNNSCTMNLMHKLKASENIQNKFTLLET